VKHLLVLNEEGNGAQYQSTGRSFTKPYIPVVTNLSTKLLELAKNSPKLAEYLKSKDNDLLLGNPAWEVYATNKLAETLKKERTSFGHNQKPEDEPFGGRGRDEALK